MRPELVAYLPWLLSALTIWMTLLAGSLHRRAWLVGLVNQALWLVWIYASAAWGLLPMNLALWVVYTRNHRLWILRPKLETEALATQESHDKEAGDAP